MGGILGFEWNWRGVGGEGLYTGSGVSGESGVSGVRVLWRFGAWRVAPGVLSSFSDSGYGLMLLNLLGLNACFGFALN